MIKIYRNIIKKAGFTLAEILITLLVIGVIATLTVPALITDIQDSQNKAVWKKTFSDILQANAQLVKENDESLINVFANDNDMRDKYAPYFNYVRKCNFSDVYGKCWANEYTKGMNGDDFAGTYYWWRDRSGLVLNNGIFITFRLRSYDCTEGAYGARPKCGWIIADVNGPKGPNRVGKDVFWVNILKNKAYPYGTQGDCSWSTCSSSSTGCACSALYLLQ